MLRNFLNLAVLVCIAVPNSGHSASVAGVWEATEKLTKYAEHHVLELDESGLYEYVILSDDPKNLLRSDSGSFSQIDDGIILFSTHEVQLADTLYYSADGSTLLNRAFSIEFAPGQEFDGDIHGTWEFSDLDGQPTGATFTVFQDGTFEADISTGHETGWFVIAGSAMVHFPTEASNPKLLGVPGLWTNLHVSSDVLSYTIPITGHIITARRVLTTSVASSTWGDVKFSVVGDVLHNGR